MSVKSGQDKEVTESSRRSLVKAISWRATGTFDTILISYLVTGKPTLAISIGAIEVFTKIFLYYFHERVWEKVKWGRTAVQAPAIVSAHTNRDQPVVEGAQKSTHCLYRKLS